MSVEVIISLVSVLGSAIGTFFGILVNLKLTNYRLEQLEKKVDKHNNLVERVYLLEQSNSIQDEKIKVVNHRIEDLENRA